MTARAVLQQGPRSHEVFSKLEYAHEAVAHHAVLFLPSTAAWDGRRVILCEGDSHRTGDTSRGHARQSVIEGNLGQVGHVGMSLQPVNVAPGHFPITISFFQFFRGLDQCLELSLEIIEEFWPKVFPCGISRAGEFFIPLEAKGSLR